MPKRDGRVAEPMSRTGRRWIGLGVRQRRRFSQAHLLEGYSIPYRAVLTSLPIGTTITLVLGYDIKNGGANAIDYLASYNRLLPHGVFHPTPELINPRSDIPALAGAGEVTYDIPAPVLPGAPSPVSRLRASTPSRRSSGRWPSSVERSSQ